jgi:hypothetical protein
MTQINMSQMALEQEPSGDDSTSTSAQDAVLGTYELLEAIISSLPPETIQTSKTVCKTWYKLIRSSKKIKLAAVARPLESCADSRRGSQTVRYGENIRFRLNPSLHALKILRDLDVPVGYTKVHFLSLQEEAARVWRESGSQSKALSINGVEGLLERRDEFITTPRCCAVRVHWESCMLRVMSKHDIAMDIYRPNGVTVGDVLDLTFALMDEAFKAVNGEYVSELTVLACMKLSP